MVATDMSEIKDAFWITNLTRSGQPKPYADSYWEGTVTFYHEKMSTEDNAKAAVEKRVREGYIYPKDSLKPFHVPWYNVLRQSPENPLVWEFAVQRMYLD